MDFSQILLDKNEIIIERWVEAVYEDRSIEATQELTFKAVRDSLPQVIKALASVLSESKVNDFQTLVSASLEHGKLRAEQGFEPAEIAQEYRLLRSVIFASLEPDLLQGSPTEMLRAVRLIDGVVDEAIAQCFDSYTQGRLLELKQLQKQLNLTNQELTRLVRASRDNISQLAHELKTPLTSIIGYADLFLRQQRDREQSFKDNTANFESIERVLRSGRLLLRLINDALEISRYDAGKMRLQLVPTNTRELIDSIVEIVEPLIREKELSLIVDCDRAPLTVVTDPLRIQQILTNLLSNAIRYTETGTISLKCWTPSELEWVIEITDSGIGISPEDQQQIFNPYFRSNEESGLQKIEGTGLGLAIVSRIVKLMKGKIKVTSHPGQGSTFRVTLPQKSLPWATSNS